MRMDTVVDETHPRPARPAERVVRGTERLVPFPPPPTDRCLDHQTHIADRPRLDQLTSPRDRRQEPIRRSVAEADAGLVTRRDHSACVTKIDGNRFLTDHVHAVTRDLLCRHTMRGRWRQHARDIQSLSVEHFAGCSVRAKVKPPTHCHAPISTRLGAGNDFD